MTEMEFEHAMSESSKLIIKLVCDGDHQAKEYFPRSLQTIAKMEEQYRWVLDDE